MCASQGAFNDALKQVSADKTNEMDFKQFAKFMDLLEEAMEDTDEDDDEEEMKPVSSSGKGFGAKPSPSQGTNIEKSSSASDTKNKPAKGSKSPKEDNSEVVAITKELFDDLRGKRKTLSVAALKEWEDMQEMIDSGSLKRSTLEKALVKVGSYESGEITLEQFIQLIDIIQTAVDANQLSYEYEEDEEGDKGKGFQTSKKSSVLGSSTDDDDENDSYSDQEVSEEEAARQVALHSLSIHPLDIPLNTPSQYTLSIHPLDTPSQYTLSIHPLNTPSRYTLSIHPLNTPSRYTLSIHPLDTPSRYTLSIYIRYCPFDHPHL